MFPASAGMNRRPDPPEYRRADVPRKRGDEPVVGNDGVKRDICSPQARG